MEIKNIGEFELIARLTAGRKYDQSVVLGIGDDAAVIQAPDGGSLLACTDMLVEGVHFSQEKTPPAAVGHKALAISLSDIAAMGGIPQPGLSRRRLAARLYPGICGWCLRRVICPGGRVRGEYYRRRYGTGAGSDYKCYGHRGKPWESRGQEQGQSRRPVGRDRPGGGAAAGLDSPARVAERAGVQGRGCKTERRSRKT